MEFKLWLEGFRDIFGFEEEDVVEKAMKMRRPDDKPIKHFQVNQMLESLASRKLGLVEGFQRFPNEVQWGSRAGAVRVVVGMQHTLYIEKLSHDLEGDPIWLSKRVYRINMHEYAHNFEPVADMVYEEALNILKEGHTGPNKEYTGEALADLVDDVVDRVKSSRHEYFVFNKIKKVSDNNYIIEFNARGGGVGVLYSPRSQGRINEFVIDMSFSDKKGMLHVILTSVQTGDEGVSWEIMPSIFEGWYSPKQNPKEIVETLLTAMRYF